MSLSTQANKPQPRIGKQPRIRAIGFQKQFTQTSMLCRAVVVMLKITSYSNKTNAPDVKCRPKDPGRSNNPWTLRGTFFSVDVHLKTSEGGASVPQHLQRILHEASFHGHLDALYKRRLLVKREIFSDHNGCACIQAV